MAEPADHHGSTHSPRYANAYIVAPHLRPLWDLHAQFHRLVQAAGVAWRCAKVVDVVHRLGLGNDIMDDVDQRLLLVVHARDEGLTLEQQLDQRKEELSLQSSNMSQHSLDRCDKHITAMADAQCSTRAGHSLVNRISTVKSQVGSVQCYIGFAPG